MRVIIISGKKGHYYHTALGAQKAGILHNFITTIFFKKENLISIFFPKILQQKKFDKFKKFISLRSEPKLNSKLVKPIFFPELLSQLCTFAPKNLGKSFVWISNYLFEFFSLIYIKKCDIIHICSTFGIITAQYAKKNNSIVIIDEGATHPKYRKLILKPEYKKYNQKFVLPDEPWVNRIIREYELANYIIVPSIHAFSTLTNNSISPKKVIILPLGVDIDVFHPIPKKDHKFRILYVGLISISKGIPYLLQSFKELNLKNAELVLIGSIDNSMKSLLNEYRGLYTHISFVPNFELFRYYSDSSVFVNPSLSEGFGMVILEAMACGIPVIITENCGVPIRDKTEGFIIPIRNVEELKNKLCLLYHDESLRNSMRISTRLFAENNTWEQYEERLAKTYHFLLSSKCEQNIHSKNEPSSEPCLNWAAEIHR